MNKESISYQFILKNMGICFFLLIPVQKHNSIITNTQLERNSLKAIDMHKQSNKTIYYKNIN